MWKVGVQGFKTLTNGFDLNVCVLSYKISNIKQPSSYSSIYRVNVWILNKNAHLFNSSLSIWEKIGKEKHRYGTGKQNTFTSVCKSVAYLYSSPNNEKEALAIRTSKP